MIMKKKLLYFALIVYNLPLSGCSNGDNTPVDQEKKQVLKIAKDTAVKQYGYDIIRNELPLVAKLKNDSIWVVTGTLEKGIKGGTVYVEISRQNKQVLIVTHYR